MSPTLHLRWVLGILAVLGACNHSLPTTADSSATPDDLAVAAPDMSIPDSALSCGAGGDCGTGLRCYQDQCVSDNGTCKTDDECENDTYCACSTGGDGGPCIKGLCVPWGPNHSFDDGCGNHFSNTEFKTPELVCHWAHPPGDSVTPIIADLDGDALPEIVLISEPPSALVALHAKDCTLLFTKPFDFNQQDIAIGDLDGDGVPEIVAVNGKSQIVVFDNKGNLLATAPVVLSRNGGRAGTAPLTIADIDGQLPAEILEGSLVVRYTKGSPTLQVLWNKDLPAQSIFGPISVVADLDGDGTPEVIVNATIFDGITGVDKTPPALAQMLPAPVGAECAIGDFNGDQHPDIVFVQDYMGRERVSIFDYKSEKFIFGPFDQPELGSGPPTIADVDGDKVPEFVTVTTRSLAVFSMKCAAQNPPPQCSKVSPGVLWKKVTQDRTSWSTVAAAFDFNGDGAYDLAYRDECFLRFYDGPTGKTLAAVNITSSTSFEMPTIADVDGDGHAELIVTSDDLSLQGEDLCPHVGDPETGVPWTGYTNGIFVFKDPLNRWMPARRVWNQNAYHATNITDTLAVPLHESPSWKSSNTYRAQPSIFKAAKLPDFTAGPATGTDISSKNCFSDWTLVANLCNRGAVGADEPIAGTFYSSDPRKKGANALCSTVTSGPLARGQCEVVFCSWKDPPMGSTDLWFRADDNGKAMPAAECRNGNDLLHIPGATCTNVQ